MFRHAYAIFSLIVNKIVLKYKFDKIRPDVPFLKVESFESFFFTFFLLFSKNLNQPGNKTTFLLLKSLPTVRKQSHELVYELN